MAYIRQLPSGLWQATVRMPDGRRTSQTHRLKVVVERWGKALEARYDTGDIRDPRAGKISIASWRERWEPSRVIATSTRAKGQSLWRTHCGPRWEDWPIGEIQQVDAQQWVRDLEETPRARHKGRNSTDIEDLDEIPCLSAETVHAAVNLMRGMCKAAVAARIVNSNPFSGLSLPPIVPGPPDFYEPDEAQALYAALERLFGKRWRTLVELGMDVGLRQGEIFGLHIRRVDVRRERVGVLEVATRTGIREYPKSRKSRRTVPIPPATLGGMEELTYGRSPSALVFTADEGGVIQDSNFRNRIWYVAVEAARLCGNRSPAEACDGEQWFEGECGPVCDSPACRIRVFSPKIMRHTAASQLVMDGVPLYDVQALLGHESFRTTERYAHLAPDAHAKVVAALRARTLA